MPSIRPGFFTSLFLLALAGSGCNWSALNNAGAPSIKAGEDGDLPAVVDIRKSGECPSGPANFSIRFSKPMNRANVENSLAFAEVLGDINGTTLPKRDGAVIPNSKKYVWEDEDRQLTVTVPLLAQRMYVITLALSVTDRTGKGLDGLVSADVDGDGNADIVMDDGQFARIDDDYLRKPSDFISLPFFLCDSSLSSGIWRTPLNDSRPRVLEFVGLMPNNEDPPRYTPARGVFPFGITDGSFVVQKPLPPQGVLRMQIGSPNTAPTRGFGQQNVRALVLPSTLVGNLEITAEDQRDFKAVAHLDERLRVTAPLTGTIVSAGETTITANELDGLPTDVLKGMTLVTKGKLGYVIQFTIIGNSGNTLSVDPIYFRDTQVTRPDANLNLFFPSAKFRENEISELALAHMSESGLIYGGDLFVANNGANIVRSGNGDQGSLCAIGPSSGPNASYCIYNVKVNLDKMGVAGKSFEVVSPYLYLRTQVQRAIGQVFQVHLNGGEKPITDLFGRPFVDGLADGNERAKADDVWVGSFSSGDSRIQPIPPTLQINDGRWYSIFANGATISATIEIPPFGQYEYLGNGIMGHYDPICVDGAPAKVLTDLGMVFATPDGNIDSIGSSDLLWMATVIDSNFGVYRMEGAVPQNVPSSVTGATVHADIYRDGALLKRVPTTLVRLRPATELGTFVKAGDDGQCGTSDDQATNKTRVWQTGDRLIISHRVKHPFGDLNNLDGNFDGVLEDDYRDDILLEYRPAATTQFIRLQ